MTVGEKIQELMDWSGKQQKELATLTGIPRSSISDYVRGARIPTIDTAQKIADALGVSLWAVLNGEPMAVTETDLTEKERRMVKEYRELSRTSQGLIDSTMQALKKLERRE